MIAAPVVLAAVALFSGVASVAGPDASGGSLVLIDRTPGVVHLLAPGSTASWRVGVATDVMRVDSIDVRVDLPESSALDPYLTISVRGCTVQWTGTVCPATTIEISPSVAATAWRGRSVPVVLPGDIVPRDLDLMVGVTLVDAAPSAVSGQVAQLRLEVFAAGELAGAGPGVPTDMLPNTGFGLLRSLVAGVVAIAAGLAVAALGRLRGRGCLRRPAR